MIFANIQEKFEKIFWSCAPLLWGFVTYFLAWGPGRIIPLSYPMRVALAITLLGAYFFKVLQERRKTVSATWFGYQLYLPSWLFFSVGSVAILILYQLLFGAWQENPIVNSLVFGACSGAILEELFSRSVFVKYSMGPVEFTCFNILNALCFTLMHGFYQPIFPPWHALLFEYGHFQFSFFLGLIAYKSQRIELCMLLHMLGNLVRYTIPALILMEPSVTLPLSTAIVTLELLILGGIGHVIGRRQKDRIY